MRSFPESRWLLDLLLVALLAVYFAFDVSRYLLPLATNTSLGQIVNARTLESQISRLLSDPHEEVRQLAGRLINAQEDERSRIARELHDDVIELSLTTTVMLRSIAEIAHHEGKDLSTLEARLACLEVFAFGTKRTNENIDVGYYAARTLISKYTSEVAALFLECGAIDASAPVVSNLVTEIVSRFGVVVSDKVAAGAVPIIGALSGATVNVIFMDHFQKIAKGHFTLRRLERTYGSAHIRQHYATLATKLPKIAP